MFDKKKRKILVASDTHGKNEYLENVLKAFCFDELIICGDGEGLEEELDHMAGCPSVVRMVKGNNDYNPGLMNEIVFPIGTRRTFVAHGHRYRLYEGLDALAIAARARECSLCLFGHIHKPVCMEMEGIIFINPGSLSEPRQEGHEPTCAVLELDNERMSVRFLNGKTLQEYPLEGTEKTTFQF